MKRLLFALLACMPALAAAAPSWLLVDGDSQQVFEARNAEARQPMGGLVSLMVFYTAYKEIRDDPAALDRKITVTEEMAGVLAPEATRCTSKPGETLTVRQALQAIAVNGAQDACLALAQAISKEKKISFVQRMNDNARALRMPSTEYAAPFAQDGQFTTAFDTARLAGAVRKLAGEDFSWFSRQVLLVGDHPVKSSNRALRKHPDITGLLQCGDSRSVVASLHKQASAQQLPRSIYAVILAGGDEDRNA
ncbi:MAG: serine hydrolase, partial [Duodenibacillus sp.]|nr:serine hydrolase [Duodenibacillus sp.]